MAFLPIIDYFEIKNMKKIIVVLSVLSTLFGYAQNDITNYVALRDQLKVYDGNGQISGKEIEGTPYYTEEFLEGVIIKEGFEDQNAYFRFNVLKDIVEIKVKKNHSEIFILPRVEDFVFDLEDYSLIFKTLITQEGDVVTGYYFNYFENDNIMFIAKPKSKITAEKKAETSYEKDKPSKIVINMEYYISFNGDPLTEVRIKEKDFKKLLDDSPELSIYFKENKVKEIEDVVKLLEFYDSVN